jgi:solute carrier family 25 phosphate transporter 23/24/25/41
MVNGETANEFDARVEALWQTLDAPKRGYLDLAGLKKGLNRMDHRAYKITLCHMDHAHHV